MTVQERFWNKVSKGDSCWEWTATTVNGGYGHFKVAGKMVLAHRMAYELEVGLVPDGLCVCHSCDNPSCVNPDHLWIGTQADNIRDMGAKKRASGGSLPGERNPSSKLTADEVENIRANRMNLTQKEMAALFGISHQTVWSIVHNKRWTSR